MLMIANDFNTKYLNNLLDKVSKEQKSVFLLGDFNVSLLNYNDHNPTNEFLDSFASNSYILQPTRLTSHSKTLIDNIFCNIISPEAISGNLILTISDHLPQFMIVPNVFSRHPPQTRLTFLKKIGETLITFLLIGINNMLTTQLNLSLIKLTHY